MKEFFLAGPFLCPPPPLIKDFLSIRRRLVRTERLECWVGEVDGSHMMFSF